MQPRSPVLGTVSHASGVALRRGDSLNKVSDLGETYARKQTRVKLGRDAPDDAPDDPSTVKTPPLSGQLQQTLTGIWASRPARNRTKSSPITTSEVLTALQGEGPNKALAKAAAEMKAIDADGDMMKDGCADSCGPMNVGELCAEGGALRTGSAVFTLEGQDKLGAVLTCHDTKGTMFEVCLFNKATSGSLCRAARLSLSSLNMPDCREFRIPLQSPYQVKSQSLLRGFVEAGKLVDGKFIVEDRIDGKTNTKSYQNADVGEVGGKVAVKPSCKAAETGKVSESCTGPKNAGELCAEGGALAITRTGYTEYTREGKDNLGLILTCHDTKGTDFEVCFFNKATIGSMCRAATMSLSSFNMPDCKELRIPLKSPYQVMSQSLLRARVEDGKLVGGKLWIEDRTNDKTETMAYQNNVSDVVVGERQLD